MKLRILLVHCVMGDLLLSNHLYLSKEKEKRTRKIFCVALWLRGVHMLRPRSAANAPPLSAAILVVANLTP
jgi:hypothetical protein